MAGCIEFCISRLIHTKYLSPFFGIRKFNSSPSFLLSFAFICKTLSASDSDFILGHQRSSFASDTGKFSSQCRAVVPTPAEVGHMVSMSFISPDLSFPMCRVCFCCCFSVLLYQFRSYSSTVWFQLVFVFMWIRSCVCM